MCTCRTDSKQEAGWAIHPWKQTLDWTFLPLGNQARLESPGTHLACIYGKSIEVNSVNGGISSDWWPEAKTILAAELVPAFIKYGNGKGHPERTWRDRTWPTKPRPIYTHIICIILYMNKHMYMYVWYYIYTCIYIHICITYLISKEIMNKTVKK